MTDERCADLGPEARRTGWKSLVRDNWYRDVWLFVISLLVLATIVVGVSSNGARIDDIQTSRLKACEDQNRRHDNALLAVDAIIEAQPNGRQKRRAIENKQFTVLFVNAMLPRLNCKKRVGSTPTAAAAG